ncbi:glycosyltransferase family 2 protein [Chryseobacterium taichungense]|uniref:glycosyltransferase family 2 protein n=1 Tax=Chryseobacterium taichungense TaxID=295069 RepID=UPI0028A94F7A|nr:glycosyltransferase family 2 protein [Chryseobacterium taichungense]
MKISLLIVCYNGEKYIRECIESILSQDYSDFEIIILDDASIDQSLDIIKEYSEGYSNIRYFVNPSNKGIGFSKRQAIEFATGEICGFVDADDTLEPECLKKVVDGFVSTKENIDAVYTQYYICNKEMEKIDICKTASEIPYQKMLFFNINFEVAHFFCFKKLSYLKTSGIEASLLSTVDQDLYLKLYEVGRFKFIKEPLYNYRLHTGGISQNKSKKKKLYENWHFVLSQTLERRNIKVIYKKNVKDIPNLPNFIWQKQNNFFRRVIKKISGLLHGL